MPFQEHRVLFSFGLLRRNKGPETVLWALPAVVAHSPSAVHAVLGTTHPGVVRRAGEEYRGQRKRLALQPNV